MEFGFNFDDLFMIFRVAPSPCEPLGFYHDSTIDLHVCLIFIDTVVYIVFRYISALTLLPVAKFPPAGLGERLCQRIVLEQGQLVSPPANFDNKNPELFQNDSNIKLKGAKGFRLRLSLYYICLFISLLLCFVYVFVAGSLSLYI